MKKKILKEFDERYPKAIYVMVKDLLGHGDVIGNVDQRIRIRRRLSKAMDSIRKTTLEEAIEIFKKYKDEPMTGRVVLIELMALKDGKPYETDKQ